MRRILLIAKRDYTQAVMNKAYVFGLILLPLLFGGVFLILSLAGRSNNKNKDERIAIIDRTGISASTVIKAFEDANAPSPADAPARFRATPPHFSFEEVKPEPDTTAQLLSLSDRIRQGDLFLVLDISAEALHPTDDPKRELIHYYTNSTGLDLLGLSLPDTVNEGLRRVRLAQLGLDPARVPEALREVSLVSMDLLTKDSASGGAVEPKKKNPLQAAAVPFFLVFLMVMVVMIGAAPHLGAVAEDKMQRVFEMLLGSASPFELMMGKVLAALGVSLTSSTFYIIGGLLALAGLASIGLAPLHLLPWFFAYLIADVLMLAALGLALGSACNTPQDAQQLAFILFLPVMIPMFMLAPVIEQPNGTFATAMSFVPPFTPVIMLLRQALPGGVPWWQPWLGLTGVFLCALAVVWAAARIFRIGVLAQGKVPKLRELAQWVVRG